VQTPGFVNYPDSSPNLAFSLWITSGLPLIWEQSRRPRDSHISDYFTFPRLILWEMPITTIRPRLYVANFCRLPLVPGTRILCIFVARFFRFLLLVKSFCLNGEEGRQREIENGECHSDYQPHDAADQ
jgi:hypothetical protein